MLGGGSWRVPILGFGWTWTPLAPSMPTYQKPEIGFPSQIISKISLIDVAYFFIHVNFSTRTTTYINNILLSCELFINSLKLGAPRPFQLAPAPCCQRLWRTRPWLPIRGREMYDQEMYDREMSGRRMSCFRKKRWCNFGGKIQISGDPDGPDPPDGAGAAGGHLGGGPSIRSSSGGPDEAIDTPSMSLRPVVRLAQ